MPSWDTVTEAMSHIERADALAALAVVISLAALAYNMTRARLDHRVAVKPALVFAYDFASGWHIHNIGAGPALNIVVAFRDFGHAPLSKSWMRPVRIPPIGKDGSFPIHWAPHDNDHGFGATYFDVWDRPYSTICTRDLNTVRPGNRLRKWKAADIAEEWKLRPQPSETPSVPKAAPEPPPTPVRPVETQPATAPTAEIVPDAADRLAQRDEAPPAIP
jgi:hypothetical protein